MSPALPPEIREVLLLIALYLSAALGGTLAAVHRLPAARLAAAVALAALVMLVTVTAARDPRLLPVAILGRVDLIVSNPPYVADYEYDFLPSDVRREPREALVAGPTGLEVIQRIGASAADWLRPGGVVICEIAATQGVSAPSSFYGVSTVVRKDLSDRDRYVVAVKP